MQYTQNDFHGQNGVALLLDNNGDVEILLVGFVTQQLLPKKNVVKDTSESTSCKRISTIYKYIFISGFIVYN